MKFREALIHGTLIKRYKRFLADVALEDGSVVTAHSANTGSMMGCAEPGSRVLLSDSHNPKRKYPLTWELVEARPELWVGINTQRSNALVQEAIEQGVIPKLAHYQQIRTEVRYGDENSRIDLLLSQDGGPDCYVEVKNVTLVVEGVALFPDAVTVRGQKHIRELMLMVEQGHRAAMVFCIQREDANAMAPADKIDPVYGELLRTAVKAGVEVYALVADVSAEGIELNLRVPVLA